LTSFEVYDYTQVVYDCVPCAWIVRVLVANVVLLQVLVLVIVLVL